MMKAERLRIISESFRFFRYMRSILDVAAAVVLCGLSRQLGGTIN